MADRMPQWQVQQQLRDQRRRKQPGKPAKVKMGAETPTGFRTLKLVVRDRHPETLRAAYLRLKDDVLTTYFKRYRFHDPRQSAVMAGEVVLPDLPVLLYDSLLRRLTAKGGGWQLGKLAS